MINLNEGFTPEEELPTFIPGQVVYHLKYGYRGLVVDTDPTCQAPDVWYQSNQTQPDRNQPWYHDWSTVPMRLPTPPSPTLNSIDRAPVVHPMLNLFLWNR